ncbi:MAG: oligosaccharide flippase family protein [Calditrichia bacterium]|nr:oligosaccharide flippase family protein [Calditrichia bacterium]
MKKIRQKLNTIVAVSEQKKLSANFANFGLFQIINYIVPLVTIPYIVRIIGPEKFGILSIAQAITYYLWIITDYGYSISGVQLISQSEKDSKAGSKIVKNVFTIQFSINLFCFLLLILIFNIYSPFTAYKEIFIFYFFSTTANILLATWLYTGLEKVKFISSLGFIYRIIYVILIFLLLKSENDYFLVPILYSGSMLIGGFISVSLMVTKFKYRFNRSIPLTYLTFLRQDRQIYISNIFANLYRNSNVLILSIFASEASVGIYSAGEKIVKAIQGTFTPITQSFYPYISRITKTSQSQSIRVIKYTIIFISVIAGSVATSIFVFSDYLTNLAFGENFSATALIIKITSPVILFGVINFVVGIIFMINYGMKKEFSYSVITVGLTNIVICSLLSYSFGAIGTGISFLMAEALMLVVMSFFIFKNNHKWKVVDGN